MRILLIAVLMLQGTTATRADTGSVTGLILTVDGKPAADVRVAAMAVDDPGSKLGESLLGITKSDESGHFRIENIPPGRYRIIAGRVDVPTFYPGTSQAAGATTLPVTRGSIIKEINFTVSEESVRPQPLPTAAAFALGLNFADDVGPPASPQLQGKIVSERGGVFFNMPNRIVVTTKGTGGSTNTVVHADGTFAVTLPWGEHNIALELPSGYSVISMSLDSADLLSQPILLAQRVPFGTIKVTLRTPHLKTIRGRVVDESASTPVTGATIVLRDSNGAKTQMISSANGSFEFLGANPGSYFLDVSLPYYISLHQTIVMEDRDLNLDLQISKP